MENTENQTVAVGINMLQLLVDVMNELGADQTTAVVDNELLVGEAQSRRCASTLLAAIKEQGAQA